MFPRLCHLPVAAVADRKTVGSEIAHERQAANPATGIPSKVDNEPVSTCKFVFENGVNFIREVDADLAWEKADFEVGDSAWLLAGGDSRGFGVRIVLVLRRTRLEHKREFIAAALKPRDGDRNAVLHLELWFCRRRRWRRRR